MVFYISDCSCICTSGLLANWAVTSSNECHFLCLQQLDLWLRPWLLWPVLSLSCGVWHGQRNNNYTCTSDCSCIYMVWWSSVVCSMVHVLLYNIMYMYMVIVVHVYTCTLSDDPVWYNYHKCISMVQCGITMVMYKYVHVVQWVLYQYYGAGRIKNVLAKVACKLPVVPLITNYNYTLYMYYVI